MKYGIAIFPTDYDSCRRATKARPESRALAHKTHRSALTSLIFATEWRSEAEFELVGDVESDQ
jgi:hypothetical protein